MIFPVKLDNINTFQNNINLEINVFGYIDDDIVPLWLSGHYDNGKVICLHEEALFLEQFFYLRFWTHHLVVLNTEFKVESFFFKINICAFSIAIMVFVGTEASKEITSIRASNFLYCFLFCRLIIVSLTTDNDFC